MTEDFFFYKRWNKLLHDFDGIDCFYINFQLKFYIKIIGLSNHYNPLSIDGIIYLVSLKKMSPSFWKKYLNGFNKKKSTDN